MTDKATFEPPFQVKNWYVAVTPVRLKSKTDGGIILADETLELEESIAAVGKVVSIGELAFKATTRAQLKMADDTVEVKVGDFVLYPHYAGMTVNVYGRDSNGDRVKQPVRLMKDDSIIAVTDKPGAFLDIQ